jgi:hypothetical protein
LCFVLANSGTLVQTPQASKHVFVMGVLPDDAGNLFEAATVAVGAPDDAAPEFDTLLHGFTRLEGRAVNDRSSLAACLHQLR